MSDVSGLSYQLYIQQSKVNYIGLYLNTAISLKSEIFNKIAITIAIKERKTFIDIFTPINILIHTSFTLRIGKQHKLKILIMNVFRTPWRCITRML